MYRSHIGPQHAPHKAASTADIDAVVVVVFVAPANTPVVIAPVVPEAAANAAATAVPDDVVWHFISMGTKTDDTQKHLFVVRLMRDDAVWFIVNIGTYYDWSSQCACIILSIYFFDYLHIQFSIAFCWNTHGEVV